MSMTTTAIVPDADAFVNAPAEQLPPMDRATLAAWLPTLTAGLRPELWPHLVGRLQHDQITLIVINTHRSATILLRCRDAGSRPAGTWDAVGGIYLFGGAVAAWCGLAPWPHQQRHTQEARDGL